MTKREKHIETIVAWLMPIQPKMLDEPGAYKAAMIRMGATAAFDAIDKEG